MPTSNDVSAGCLNNIVKLGQKRIYNCIYRYHEQYNIV